MFILKKGHQPGVYVPLRALFLVAQISGDSLQDHWSSGSQLILIQSSLILDAFKFWQD